MGAARATAGKTDWDSMRVTQTAAAGTNIPKSFVLNGLKAGGHEKWGTPKYN